MKITLLGTGTSQGVPVIGCECNVCSSIDVKDSRLRCSVYIQTQNKNIVIDTGPDFRMQCLKFGIKKLDAVVFTHEHKDHVGGLDDIRPFNYKQQKDMDVYCTEQVRDSLHKQYDYIFANNKYPGIPKINIELIGSENFYIGTTLFEPIKVLHHNLPVLGFKIGEFVYITDANYISESEIAKIKGCKVLILNALHHQEHISHFNLKQAIDVAKIIGAEQTYFTHISHNMGLFELTNNQLPPQISLAYDGLSLDLAD